MLNGESLFASEQPPAALRSSLCESVPVSAGRTRLEPELQLWASAQQSAPAAHRILRKSPEGHFCFKKEQCLTLCLPCSLHLQPAGELRASVFLPPPVPGPPLPPPTPGQSQVSAVPRTGSIGRGRTAVLSASAAFPSFSPAAAAPACTGWEENSQR